jgi:DNA damage-binding protein 1
VDAVHSLTVLKIGDGSRLETVARDYGPLWPISLKAVDRNTLIGANVECNLFSFKVSRQTGRLENDGMFYIDDQVNSFVNGVYISYFADSGGE